MAWRSRWRDVRVPLVASTLIVALVAGPAYATPGSLDASFSTDGRATIDFGTGFEGAEALAIGQDGTILVVGGVDQGGPNEQLALGRFTSDGVPDPSFGGGDGAEVVPSVEYGYGVALQDDGKIVVVAPDFVAPGNVNWMIVRLDAAGLPDASFGGGDGIVITDFGPEAASPSDVAIQPDGMILVAGSTTVLGDQIRMVLGRYDTDGNLDPSFGTDGLAKARIGVAAWARSLAIAGNGKIVVAGTCQVREQNDLSVVRFRSDGTLDPRFSSDGKVRTNFAARDDGADVAIQSDGRILVVGQAGGTGTKSPDFAVVRYLPRGRLDKTFSGDGKTRTDFKGEEDWARGVGIQTNGKIVVGGFAYKKDVADFALARYRITGRLDRSFGALGLRRTDFGAGKNDYAFDLGLQADGGIVAVGWATPSAGYDAGVARYLAA
jgi:uncharacterized delta-60 repeat protein